MIIPKTPFMGVICGSHFTEIMPKASTLTKITIPDGISANQPGANVPVFPKIFIVDALNAVRTDHQGPVPLKKKKKTIISFRLSIQTLIQNKNFFEQKSYNLEVRFIAYKLFPEFIYTHFILNITFISHFYLKNYYFFLIWTNNLYIYIYINYIYIF